VHELERELQSQTLSKPRRSAGQVTRDAFASVLGLIGSMFGQRRASNTPAPNDCPAEMELPAYNAPADTTNQLYGDETNPRSLYLLLCVDVGGSRTALHQQRIDNINRDRDLFRSIRAQYLQLCRTKRWLTIQSLKCLSLTKVCPFITRPHPWIAQTYTAILTRHSSNSTTAILPTFKNTTRSALPPLMSVATTRAPSASVFHRRT
jgi:hypothetical protein